MRYYLLLVAQDVAHEVLVLRLLTVVTVVQELLGLPADDRLPILQYHFLGLLTVWQFQVNVFDSLLLDGA